MKYKKKPIIIDAVKYDGINIKELVKFAGRNIFLTIDPDDPFRNCYMVRTLEGNLKISIDDYVIRGIQGEFYPCKPDIFDATYESVE